MGDRLRIVRLLVYEGPTKSVVDTMNRRGIVGQYRASQITITEAILSTTVIAEDELPTVTQHFVVPVDFKPKENVDEQLSPNS